MNTNLLLSKMALHGINRSKLAEIIGVEPHTVTSRLNIGNFKQDEIREIKRALNLTAEEVTDIFFAG